MPGIFGLLGVIAFNYCRYRRGLPTICATTRRYVPRPVSVAGIVCGASFLGAHIWRGYPPRILPRT